MMVQWKLFFWILIESHLADYEYKNKNIYNCFECFWSIARFHSPDILIQRGTENDDKPALAQSNNRTAN